MKKYFPLTLSLLILFWGDPLLYGQKVKTVGGVQIVENGKKPNPPKDTPTELVLEEEIAVGAGENEEAMVTQPSFLAVDDRGVLFVCDAMAHCVKVFDRTGKYMQTIGKQGQGPGELNMPSGIHITPEKELMVEDVMNKRLSYFTLDGKFLRNTTLIKQLSIINMVMDSNGNFLGREFVMEGNQMYFELRKYDTDLNTMFAIDKVPFQNPMQGKINIFDLLFIYLFGPGDNIYYGSLKDYEIQIIDPEGKLMKRIRRDYDPVKVTKKDKERILNEIPDVGMGMKDRFEFPEYFPAYESFLLDDEGRLIVRTYKKGKTEGEYALDVFDQEGRFIAQIPTKINPRLWKKGKVYSIEDTEEGFKVVKRYRYSWQK